MKDLSSALERLRVAFATPTPGLGAPGPAEEGDKDMGDADGTERATPPEEAQTQPTKRLKSFVAASQKATSQANKPVTLVPVDGKQDMAVGQNQWYHFGVGAAPVLEPILVVGLGCQPLGAKRAFVLPHGQSLSQESLQQLRAKNDVGITASGRQRKKPDFRRPWSREWMCRAGGFLG